MNNPRSKFLVHAEIFSTGHAAADFDDEMAGHPQERRLNRIERVTAAYRGRIDLRFDNGMLITFDSADAALLGACEMQHRCVVLPQTSGIRLALRIGVHQGLVRQRAIDGADNARAIVAQLAIVDDGIVASDLVIASASLELLKLTHPLTDISAGQSAHKVEWRSEISSSAYGNESYWPTSSVMPHQASPYIFLYYGLKTMETTEDHPLVTFGRDPISDLVLSDHFVSRNHAKIERKPEGIILTDMSTNGTCVKPDEGLELLVRNGSIKLKNKGLIFFGRPFNGDRRGGIRYEVY